MKNKVMAIAMALGAFGASGAVLAQTSVGVSIGINQPGVYGRINIGDVPRPALILPQPVLIAPPPVVYERAPIYLYVPPAHQRDWRHYCGRYGACGQPVYFVREDWVRERYTEAHPGWDRGRHQGWERDDDRGDGHGKYKKEKKDKGHGHGHGHDD